MIQRSCQQCTNKFLALEYQVKIGQGKFCSKICYYLSMKGKVSHGVQWGKGHTPWNKGLTGVQAGENHPNWRGDKVGYWGIHNWLISKFGNADHCENPKHSTQNPKRYEWSKLHGVSYERKRENFWQLCKNCHRKYDFTEETRKRISIAKKGIPNYYWHGKKRGPLSEERRKKIGEATTKRWVLWRVKHNKIISDKYT